MRRLEAQLAEHMQRRILHRDAELLVLNKPAGLAVQGGDGIQVSLDSLLPHLRFGSTDNPRRDALILAALGSVRQRMLSMIC